MKLRIGLIAVSLLVTACGSAAATPSPAPPVVQIAESGYGPLVVDADGFALYSDGLEDRTDNPLCVDACAESWPPLIVSGDFTVGEGLDRSRFSTVTRPDGSLQVKYGNLPLYRFVNDDAPGDNVGQGVRGKWFLVRADGTGVYE
jgi:predicted lipoprotein with Yx(FWY)xxD motif